MPSAGRIRFQTTIAVLLALLLIAITAAWFALPAREWLQSLLGWVRELGSWGLITYGLFYVILVVLLAPAEVLTIVAGLMFGAWAFPLVIVSATIGAALAFLLSRYLLRRVVRTLMERRRFLRAVDRAIADEGWKAVALFRLNPLIPFNLQNYFFGAMSIGLLPYLAATFFGIMPGSAAYVYLGSLGRVAVDSSVHGGLKIALLVLGFAATVILIVIIGRKASARLRSLGVEHMEG